MKRVRMAAALLAVVSIASGMIRAQAPAAPAPNPLEKLAWLEGKWIASGAVPGSDGIVVREANYGWGDTRKTLRFWSYVTPPGGQRQPYVDGFYVWDPTDKKIRFYYVDPGGFYEGEVKIEGNTYEHVFTGKSNRDGRIARWRYTLTDAGSGSMPIRIYADKEGAWQEFVFLTYRKQ